MSSTQNKNKTHISTDSFTKGIQYHLRHSLARDETTATKRDWWIATCNTVHDYALVRFMETQKAHHERNSRRLYYLSLEYLMGRLLNNNLTNLDLEEIAHEAITSLGLNYEELRAEETDMGLGNGGLGRLAACFLDSLATLNLPAIGYGIHYEFGLFRQSFNEGKQEEHPDNWLRYSNPWKIVRPEQQLVKLYGHTENYFNNRGDWKIRWTNYQTVVGVPWDIPIVGYGGHTVNFLRLWESKASEEFDLKSFNEGSYVDAVRAKAISETISKVLYPNDKTENGRELRLVQQYFFVSCSIQDLIRRYFKNYTDWNHFNEKVVIHLNDTHPTVAILELMRILIDESSFSWDQAWGLTEKVFAYTNHTLLPEALEKWSVPLFQKVLPRHLQILYELNHRFLKQSVELTFPGDEDKKSALSLIEEGHPKMIRMANLATLGSFSVNGVAALHTRLLKEDLFHDFYQLFPEKFNNKTNGITPRRWLKACNPKLSALIESKIGTDWITDLSQLKQLEKWADDPAFQKQFMQIKHENKEDLSKIIFDLCKIEVRPDALFDVQIKRLHEYKRQHLNLFHILTLYRRLLHNPDLDIIPRVFIFGGKAAPGYDLAKQIIFAINRASEIINTDKRLQGKIKVAFLPNYNVHLASRIIPAADLSEQISTAGKEASGTGNMKLALNGACTIGTLDGANVEIAEEVGAENCFIFGKTVEEIQELQRSGYSPWNVYHSNDELKSVLDWCTSSFFEKAGENPFHALCKSLLDDGDPFFVLADYEAYCQAQLKVNKAYQNKKKWARMAILNTARMGKFSSDRTIQEYAKEIWHLKSEKID